MRLKLFSSVSLLNRVMLFMLAFVAVLLVQLGISRYQTQYVIRPQEERTEQIQIISQFLNAVEDCMRQLENYRWDYGDTQELTEQIGGYQEESARMLSQIVVELGSSSEEQYLLFNAASTTYSTFSLLVADILELLQRGENAQAAELYYAKAEPCGAYMRQYIQELLECSVQDSQNAYYRLSRLSEQLGLLQTVIVVICGIMGAAMMTALLTLFRSIRQMSAASVAISQGDLDTPDVDERRRDEIGRMAQVFNEMKRSMKRQVQVLEEKNQMERALYKKQKEALELQNLMEQEKMQNLRSQINPHFLFNSLNVILYTAQQEGAVQTQSLISSLSNLFRYALGSNTALVPLAREVRIVEEFYALNKARFGDRVNLSWEISPELDLTETLVPSFLLQPLVENAFRHGLGPKETGGSVDISMTVQENELYICVQDDGAGMSEQTLALLRQGLEDPPDTGDHVGLYNVAARLRLLGVGYGLTIASRQGAGTQVRLRLPLVLQQSEEVQDD